VILHALTLLLLAADPAPQACEREHAELTDVLARCNGGDQVACANRHRVQENYHRCQKRARRNR
jgi:hypothetical protein